MYFMVEIFTEYLCECSSLAALPGTFLHFFTEDAEHRTVVINVCKCPDRWKGK